MRAKKFCTTRPEVEVEILNFFGWLLIPIIVLRAFCVGFRLFSFPVLIGKRRIGKAFVLSIPKLTVKRADAA